MLEVKLHNLQLSDAELFAKRANDARISLNTSNRFPHPYTLRDAETFINRFSSQDPCSVFGIQYGTDLVGGIGLHFRDDIYCKTAELGYWVSPDFWGKGIANEAIRLILPYGFAKFDLQVVVAHVFGRNKVSQHLLEKNGFNRLGVIPNGAFKLGKFEDDVIYFKENTLRTI